MTDTKDRWHLAPWDAIRAVVKAMTIGSDTHGSDQAFADTKRSWVGEFDAAQRHLSQWVLRDGVDHESRLSALIHAGTRILILISMELRGVGVDDRPSQQLKATPDQTAKDNAL